ncbi:MAG TPA: sigma-70 family RNA polymerase sigma factor [Verrucomicrobiae bacterium]|nr:sigma-70 family RNA polymerase sigma factor [Verrucomicrobiae bacterium]
MTTARPNPVFATTKWTRVLAARGDSTDARVALGELCEVYYEPVVAYLRARWRDEDRARELAHAFFERLLARPSLAGAHPERGRFRSYLLGALKHFLADLRDCERAAKRGAGAEHLPLEAGTDTSPGLDPPAAEGRPPEVEFDRQWALTILNRSLNALAAEHDTADRREEFSALKPWLVPGTVGVSQAEVAGRLGVNESAVKVAIHRLRKRFRELVKAEIARTVDEPSQVNTEMSYLVTVLAG